MRSVASCSLSSLSLQRPTALGHGATWPWPGFHVFRVRMQPPSPQFLVICAQAETLEHKCLMTEGADVEGSPADVRLRTSIMACSKVRLRPPVVVQDDAVDHDGWVASLLADDPSLRQG